MNPRILFKEFINSEKAGGFILIVCTTFSLMLANSSWGKQYIDVWQFPIQGHSVTDWINDGLMAIFFLLISLELKREIKVGALSNSQTALLPMISAIGGVIVPATVFLFFNFGKASQNGAGIPMATDIAFALGMLSLVGKMVPQNVKVFLTALAVIDDLCAILVIGIFYTEHISWMYLSIAASLFLLLLLFNKLLMQKLWHYLLVGICMWFSLLHSGIHATLAGVLLAFALPTVPSNKMQQLLHYPVAFVIIPLFALANTCIEFGSNWLIGLSSTNSIGIVAGLFLGKPIGILLFSWISIAFGICQLPIGVTWKHIIGAGILAGIGFTMSIFISLLAFKDIQQVDEAKIAIIFGSLLSAIVGIIFLKIVLKKSTN